MYSDEMKSKLGIAFKEFIILLFCVIILYFIVSLTISELIYHEEIKAEGVMERRHAANIFFSLVLSGITIYFISRIVSMIITNLSYLRIKKPKPVSQEVNKNQASEDDIIQNIVIYTNTDDDKQFENMLYEFDIATSSTTGNFITIVDGILLSLGWCIGMIAMTISGSLSTFFFAVCIYNGYFSP